MEVTSGDDEFKVRWANHHRAIVGVLEQLYEDEYYVDCSLAAEGREISAHKLILSACSPFLRETLRKHKDKHPVIVLKDVIFSDLVAVVEYIYKGEVKVPQDRLRSFLKTAEMLDVTGLGTRREVKEEPENAASSPKRSKVAFETENTKEAAEIDELKYNVDQVEYLSDDGEPAQEDYKFFYIDDAGNYTEFGDVSDLQPDAEIGDLLKTALVEPSLTSPTAKFVKPATVTAPTPPSGLFRVRSTKFSLRCSNCGGYYKNENSYLGHKRHDCNQIHKCSSCHKIFKNKRHLLDHVRDDCGRIHHCPKCKKQFKQKVNLTTHQKSYCKL